MSAYPFEQSLYDQRCACGWPFAVAGSCTPTQCRERDRRQFIVSVQPPPQRKDKPELWPLVHADMKAREEMGRQRYGAPFTAHNGRDMLREAYEKALDLVVYLRGALCERDGR